MDIQLFETKKYFIFRKARHSLWCIKASGQLIPRFEDDDEDREEEIPICSVFGLFGKIKFLSDTDWRILYISKATSIGKLPLGDEIFKVDEIEVLSLSPESHTSDQSQTRAGENVKKNKSPKEGTDKLEKRLLEALFRMVNGADSFFFTYNGDLTNTIQRRKLAKDRKDLPPWAKADERFFWNKAMLSDLLGPNYQGALCDPWILPVVQGYIEIQSCPLHTIVNHVPRGLLPYQSPSPPPDQDEEEGKRQSSVEDCIMGEGRSGQSDGENPTTNNGVPVGETTSNSSENREEKDTNRSSEASNFKEENNLKEGGELMSSNLPNSTGIEIVVDCPEEETERSSSNPHSSAPEVESTEDGEFGRLGELGSQASHLSFHSGHFDMSMESGEWEESGVGVVIGDNMANVLYSVKDKEKLLNVTFVIISRRSWHRAGMRYKRRGADTSGSAANYVETEFITTVGSHCTSIVMVRGSVPILWSQPGYKYKPPPVVDQDRRSNMEAVEHHFTEQCFLYDQVCIINTLNQTGNEKTLSDAFEEFLLQLNSPNLQYVAFDFHRICHGSQQIQNVQILLDNIQEISRDYRFCWFELEQNAVLSEQKGVYRVNCLDCLDRTNVVQSYVAKEVLLTMLVKLGLLNPDEQLSGEVAHLYNLVWANNGDAISQQYAGTAAMKGDLTRHGERKLSGMVKDGYNSAYRYYLNIFSYPYRQAVIDLMLGGSPSEVLKPVLQETSEEDDSLGVAWSLEREEVMVKMLDHCRRQLYPYYDPDKVKGYALCEPAGLSFLPESDFEENVVLLLYQNKPEITVANYDISKYEITSFVRIQLEYVTKIEIGVLGNMLRNSRRPHMRLFYLCNGHGPRPTYFTFKTVAFASIEEDNSILDGIASELQAFGPHIGVFRNRIDRRKCPPHIGVVYLRLPKELLEELAIKASQSSVHHDQLTKKEKQVRDAFSDDELLDCSDSYCDSIDDFSDSNEREESERVGAREEEGEGKDAKHSPSNGVLEEKRTLDKVDRTKNSATEDVLEENAKPSKSNDRTEGKGKRTGKPSSSLSKLSPKVSSKFRRMRLNRKGNKSKNVSTPGHSPSPSPRASSPSPQASSPETQQPQQIQGSKTSAKDFFRKVMSEQDSLSKLTSRVLSKLSNAPTSDREEEDPAEIRRREQWKHSKIKSVLI